MTGIKQSKPLYPFTISLFGVSLVLGLLICTALISNAGGEAFQPRLTVGYQVIDLKYPNDGQAQTLTVAVWYPTAAQPKSYTYGGPTSGNVALNAAPSEEGGPYPLFVFSHGYGGSGLSAVFFTEALAAHGWIVASPDHHDRHAAIRIRSDPRIEFDRVGFLQYAREIAASGPGDRWQYRYRLDEMARVLDGMLSSDLFGKLIDRDHIAVGGHSFGGFTALGLCGTIKARHDPRIKAVLLFSTGAGGYLFTEEELAAVRIPSMLFLGEREEDQLRGSKTMLEISTKIYRNVSSPKYFLEIKGASHFSFNNRFRDDLRARLLSGTEEQFEVIRKYAIAFLEKHVAGRKNSGRVLEGSDPMLVRCTSSKTVADDPKIAFAKSLTAKDYDDALPSVPVEQWLKKTLPENIIIKWGEYITACGEQAGKPELDQERDMPLCAEVELKEDKNTIGYLLLFIGTENKGLLKEAACLYDGYINTNDKQMPLRKLSQLSRIK